MRGPMKRPMKRGYIKWFSALLTVLMTMNLAVPLGGLSVLAAPVEKGDEEIKVDAPSFPTDETVAVQNSQGPTGERTLIYGDKQLADEDAIVLVFTGDGYARDDMDKFKEKANAAKEGLLTQNVWAEVKESLKVYMVPVVSRESGITGDRATSPAGVKDDQKDTWFKTFYWAGSMKERIGWKNKWRFDEIKRDYRADTVVVLMNSGTKGGLGGGGKAAVATGDTLVTTLRHELGHAVGLLEDEYYSSNLTEGHNVTRESDPEKVKWSRFIGKGGTGIVHAGQTASGTNWYIPTNKCMMLNSDKNKDFCEVCKNQMQRKLSENTRISHLYFQTYGDIFIEGSVPDMKSYFILRDNGEEIPGDQLGDKLTVAYYDSSGKELSQAPATAGKYKVKGEFTGQSPYESCTLLKGEYEIKRSLDEKTLQSIKIAALPNKTVYKKGEAFNSTGLSVSAAYAGNYNKVLGESDVRLAGTDTSTAGEKTVTVTYRGKVTGFTIRVIDTASTVVDGIRVNGSDATEISYGTEDWYVVGYNGAGAASESDKMTIFSRRFVKSSKLPFAESRINEYKDSGPYNYANYYEKDYVTSQESDAVARRDLMPCDQIDGQGTHTLHEDCNGIAGPEVKDVGFWSLSKKEAEQVSSTLRGHRASALYWLRTPGMNRDNVYTVCRLGIIKPDRGASHYTNGVRFATHLKKESILLMTDATNGKDSEPSGDLKLMTAPSTKQKLTLIDQGMKSGTVRVYRKTPSSPSREIEVDVQGATPGVNVSAVIVNREGKVLYYGKIGDTNSEGKGQFQTFGKIGIQLPVDISPESGNKLKIFTEKVNGNGLTDYGSNPVEFSTIPNQSPMPLLTLELSESYNIPEMTVGKPIEEIRIFHGVSGGKTPYRFTATGLPEGITISTEGLISGTPTKAGGSGTATIMVEDDAPGNKSVTRIIKYGRVEGPVEIPKPEAPNASADYANMKLTGLTPSAVYNVTPAGSILEEIRTDAQGKTDIKKEWSNRELSIVKKDTGQGTQSPAQTLRIETIYSVTMDQQEVRISVKGQSITLKAPSKDGHTFKEWTATGVTLDDASKEEITFVMPAENVTLIPSYTKTEDAKPEEPKPEEPKPEEPKPEEPKPEDSKPEEPKPEEPQPEQPAIVFPDIKQNDWFYGSVNYVTSNNIMSGYADGTFGPADKLGRAQFATTLYRLDSSPAVDYEGIFPDVPGGQFYSVPAVWANKSNIITGYANGMFGTSDTITREQLATMLYRYEIYQGADVSQGADLNMFPDAGTVSSFSRAAMSWAVGKGLISGDQGRLNPQGESSRAVTATVIQRYETKK